jgi:hypothetical protein
MKKKFDKKEWAKLDRLKNPERYKEYSVKHEQTKKRKEYMSSEKKKEYYKKRYLKKQEEIREKQKEYYLKNKEIINGINKEYYKNNKKKLIEHAIKYRKNRESFDVLYKLTNRLRSLIGNSLRKNGYTKKTKTYQILGCTFEDFKQHLESQFEPWMSWENYGKYNGEFSYGWDIDHVIPQSSSKTEDELLKLNHHSNLKPLCSKINRDIKRGYSN